MRHSSAAIGLWVLAGCQSGLQPAQLDFAQTWVGTPSTIDLAFTLDGEPVQRPVFGGPVDVQGNATFAVLPESPLDLPPRLEIGPNAAGPVTATLEVMAGGRTFHVPISANVRQPPSCSALVNGSDPCTSFIFSADAGTCVPDVAPDGTTCGDESTCEVQFLCKQGSCTENDLAPAIATCAPLATPDLVLMPVWTYKPVPGYVIILDDLFDDAGNQYIVECPPMSPYCDVASIDLNGATRWRRSNGITLLRDDAPIAGMIAGDALILEVEGTPGVVTAFKSVDGSDLWGFQAVTGLLGAVAVMSDAEVALLTGTAGSPPFQVVEVNVTGTGSTPVPPLSFSNIGVPFVGDGRSSVFGMVDQIINQGSVPAASFQLDLGTGIAIEGNRTDVAVPFGGIGSGPLAVVGSTVVTTIGAWTGTLPIADFPPSDTLFVADAVMRPDGSAFVRSQSNATGCVEQFVDSFDTTLGHRSSHCALPTNAQFGISGLTLTSTGGVVYAVASGTASRIEVLGPDGSLALDAQLGGVEDAIPGGDAVLIGGRWIANMAQYDPNGGNTASPPSNFVAAYDLKGVTGATGGWTGRAGGPTRDGTPH